MASYPDLKSYLYAKHKEILEDAVQKYIDKHLDGSGFHNLNVLSLTAYELDNFEIKSYDVRTSWVILAVNLATFAC